MLNSCKCVSLFGGRQSSHPSPLTPLPHPTAAHLRWFPPTELVAPPELVRQLAAAAARQGLIPSPEHWTSYDAAAADDEDEEDEEDEDEEDEDEGAAPTRWTAVWSAVCRVWASKWTDRAWLSRRALGIPEGELFMSVLLQQAGGQAGVRRAGLSRC